jgi:hypothetical protein
MDSRSTQLIKDGDYLFSRRQGLESLWQEQADNFYVERADFTTTRNIGQDFASHLSTSYPLMVRNELGNMISSMLRPSNKEWFAITVDDEEELDFAGRRWLEWASKRQRKIMYERNACLVRATKEADQDFVTFGQAVLQQTLNRQANGLLYRTWHLRDVAWCENYEGQVDTVHRKWKPTAVELGRYFGNKVAPRLKEIIDKNPYQTIECRHIVIPADKYQTGPSGKKWKQPFVSIYIDVQHDHILEEIGQWEIGYVIPRWQTVSGSQYAYSPCTVCALPDARLIQAITLTLQEAGEKAVLPPMIAVEEAIRSDIAVYAGGVTYVDAAYDERLGEVLRPMSQDKTGLSFGINIQQDTREMISRAFMLNKLNLPPAGGPDMTAYEVGQRVQEYIRNALPLFEPLEADYNGALCEQTFNTLMRLGAFGSPKDMPDSLSNRDVRFKFASPLTEAIGRDNGQRFLESKALLTAAAELDRGSIYMLNAREALRDTLVSIETPVKWLRDDKEIDAYAGAQKEEIETAQMLEAAEKGSMVAKNMGQAQQAMASVAPTEAGM